MSTREILRQQFLDANGWGGVDCPLLAGDASFRKYYRLQREDEVVVLMDAPPPQEDVRPFINVGEFLLEKGFSAPQIFAKDVENGFLLLEDLGDDTYTRLLGKDHNENDLYALATDILIDLHQNSVGIIEGLAPYDLSLLMKEVLLLPDWWMVQTLGEDLVSDEVREAYIRAWASALERLSGEKNVLVLRDYHVDNLLLLPDREGTKACGLLDFQDAVAGSGLYDLMSLLEDARRDIEPSLVEEMKQRYLAAFEDLDRDHFDAIFAILAAQRHAKVIGIFVRLCVRDGKPIYLHHIPRVWKLLERALEHPVLAEVKEWMDIYIAQEARGIPQCLKQ